jgi:hypothetical protein
MFGDETKALGENYLEAARIAYSCAQHDQFIMTFENEGELQRLEEAQRKMLIKMKEKYGFEINMEQNSARDSERGTRYQWRRHTNSKERSTDKKHANNNTNNSGA